MSVHCTPLHDGMLEIRGRDATKFLQGYVTCDLKELKHDVWLPGAICNLQGRVVTNFRLIQVEGGLLLKMHRDLVPAIREFLKKYIVFSKAETREATDEWLQFGIAGKAAHQLIEGWFGRQPEGLRPALRNAAGIALSLPGPSPRFELWIGRDRSQAAVELLSRETTPADASSWKREEIEAGWAWVEPATTNEYLPQMLNLQAQGAISFTKGCYLGQEIVARTQYRGQLKRRMLRFDVPGSAAVGQAVVTASGEKVGEVVSAVTEGDDTRLLAVVRDNEEATLFLAEAGALLPQPLPYAIMGD